jgi:GntR family transcriptional regulator, transcriptional repressor for pyruvate dehydrogenase complex
MSSGTVGAVEVHTAWRSPGPAHEQVAAHIRQSILSGELGPGARLPNEIELAETFGVSRTTIREALGGLVGQGLIVKTRGLTGGSYVAEPSIDQLSETMQVGLHLLGRSEGISVEEFVEIRELLEVPAARLAAERRTDEDLVQLAATIPPVEKSHPDSRGRRVGDLHRHRADRWFHTAVVDICRNRLLTLAAEPIFIVLQQQMMARRYGVTYHREIIHQHRDIAAAIEAGDPDRSGELMREHLEWLRPSYRMVWQAPAR